MSWACLVVALVPFALAASEPPNIFAEPEKTCALLQEDGTSPIPWHPTAYGYECSAIHEGIKCVVSGDDGLKAKRVKLILGMTGAPTERDKAAATLAKVVQIVFERLGLKPSPKLRAAIKAKKQLREHQPAANITYDPGRSTSKVQVVIIRDPGIRVVAIPRSPDRR